MKTSSKSKPSYGSSKPAAKKPAAKKPDTIKKLTDGQKYRQLKSQTEAAGMKVMEMGGKIVVSRPTKSKAKK